jgi:hypothetical protein
MVPDESMPVWSKLTKIKPGHNHNDKRHGQPRSNRGYRGGARRTTAGARRVPALSGIKLILLVEAADFALRLQGRCWSRTQLPVVKFRLIQSMGYIIE